jgi:hypothetical protein
LEWKWGNTGTSQVKVAIPTPEKPLAVASGHGRYIAVTPEREILSVWEWPLHITISLYAMAVSLLLLKPPCGGFSFRSRSRTRNRHLGQPGSRSRSRVWLKIFVRILGASTLLYMYCNSFPRRRRWALLYDSYRNKY